MTALDDSEVSRLRADTPGCARVRHFDSAGASLVARPVLRRQVRHLTHEASVGGYRAAREAGDEILATYESLATLLGCSSGEVALTPSATHAWNQAFHSIPLARGDRILTSETEYAGNFLVLLHAARRLGVTVEVVPSDASGQVEVGALEAMIDERVRLIAITHVPTNGGLVNPAEEIGACARRHGITYLLDACQSIGQLDVDVGRIGCDLLAGSGRKYLRGPRGTGFLYASRCIVDRLEPAMIDPKGALWRSRADYLLRPGAVRFETWEHNVAATLGLGVAVRYANDLGIGRIADRVTRLGAQLREILAAIEGVTVHDRGVRRCGIVTFTVAGAKADDVLEALRARRINVSVSRPEFTLIDMSKRRLPSLVRASVHYFNTGDELEALGGAIERLVARSP